MHLVGLLSSYFEYCVFSLCIGNVTVTEHWVSSKSHSLGWSIWVSTVRLRHKLKEFKWCWSPCELFVPLVYFWIIFLGLCFSQRKEVCCVVVEKYFKMEIMLFAFIELGTVCWNNLNSVLKIMAESIRWYYSAFYCKSPDQNNSNSTPTQLLLRKRIAFF